MDINYYKKYEPIFGAWTIERLIGEGGFGKVFEIHRTEFGTVYKAALKVITIPQNQSEIKSVMADGMSFSEVKLYYENLVQEIVKESKLMSKLKGNSNIVSYEDHVIIEHTGEIGWDILIRMELLTPLIDYYYGKAITAKEIANLGIDICKALEICERKKIIHRDIKLENIFVSDNGDYKLGDFGIARTVEHTMSGMSRKGTYSYMAPEVYRGNSYGMGSDIYSLGIVLYRLLNNNRGPFFPDYPRPITVQDRENALIERVKGTPIVLASKVSRELSEVVEKACSFLPEDRYHSASEMKNALLKAYTSLDDSIVLDNRSVVNKSEDNATDETDILTAREQGQKKNKPQINKKIIAIIAICTVVLVGVLVGISNKTDKTASTKEDTPVEETSNIPAGNAEALLESINSAADGTKITVEPGEYSFNICIEINNEINLIGSTEGEVIFHAGMKINAADVRIENIKFDVDDEFLTYDHEIINTEGHMTVLKNLDIKTDLSNSEFIVYGLMIYNDAIVDSCVIDVLGVGIGIGSMSTSATEITNCDITTNDVGIWDFVGVFSQSQIEKMLENNRINSSNSKFQQENNYS